jgi:hypothetical protein
MWISRYVKQMIVTPTGFAVKPPPASPTGTGTVDSFLPDCAPWHSGPPNNNVQEHPERIGA